MVLSETLPVPGVEPRKHAESWSLRVGMRWRVGEGAFSCGRTWSISWDARDTHRTEMLFLHRNVSRLLALITAVPEYLNQKQVGGKKHLVWPAGSDVGNAAHVRYASENASREINSVTAINKEGKSDPLQPQGSSQCMSGQWSKGKPTSAPTPLPDN